MSISAIEILLTELNTYFFSPEMLFELAPPPDKNDCLIYKFFPGQENKLSIVVLNLLVPVWQNSGMLTTST